MPGPLPRPRAFLLLLVALSALLASCHAADVLPTVAAVAFVPPTPPVIVPSPTLAATTTAEGATDNRPQTTAEQPTATPPSTTDPPNTDPSASPPRCSSPGRVEQGVVDSVVAGQLMSYRVYLPPCYGQDGRRYPTLYLFGGNIHNESLWDSLGIDEAANAAIRAGRIAPLLIVMPDNGWLANNTTSGPASYEGFILSELIPHVEATYCAWPAREGRAVGGLSRGGYWSLMMAFRRPDLFHSVGGHSPALVDSFAGPAEDPVVTGVVNDLGDLRVWIDLGERDPYLTYARPLHDALTADGVAHEWRVNPGQHDAAYWQSKVSDYLAWYTAGFPADRTTLPPCP